MGWQGVLIFAVLALFFVGMVMQARSSRSTDEQVEKAQAEAAERGTREAKLEADRLAAEKAEAARAATSKLTREKADKTDRSAVAANQAGKNRLRPCPSSYSSATWTNSTGEETDRDGLKFVREFQGGKPNGRGTPTSVNGAKYVVGFRDGKRYGHGTYTWPGRARRSCRYSLLTVNDSRDIAAD